MSTTSGDDRDIGGERLSQPFAWVMYALTLGLVVLAPLPLGSNVPWAWNLLAVGMGGLVLLWTAGVLLGWTAIAVPLHRVGVVALPFLALVLWVLGQRIPWVPASWAHPLWAEASAALGEPLAGTVTVSPVHTDGALLRLTTYAIAFWLMLQFGARRQFAQWAVAALAVAGLGYACYGVLIYVSGNQTVAGIPKWTYFGDLTATFVSRNSYATYAGLGMLCLFALLLGRIGKVRRQTSGLMGEGVRTLEMFLGRSAPLSAAFLVLMMALLQTHSRLGFSATMVALMAIAGLAATARLITLPQLGILFAACVVGSGVALAVSGDVTFQRLLETSEHEPRFPLFQLVLRGVADGWLQGSGYGTFAGAFAMYRDGTLADEKDYTYAHSVYLEAAFELGIPGALLMVAMAGGAAWLCLRGVLVRHRDRHLPALGVGATVLVGVHALADFSPQMPATAVTYAALMGLACAQSFPSGRHRGRHADKPAEGSGDA